jgi:hypothetical protein
MMHSLKSCLKLTSFPCRSGRNGEKKGGCDWFWIKACVYLGT